VAKQPAKGRKTAQRKPKTGKAPAKKAESSVSSPVLFDAIPAEVRAQPASSPAQEPSENIAEAPERAAPEPTKETISSAPASPAPQRSGGIIPLLLGGVAAGAIGFFIATVTASEGTSPLADQLAEQGGALNALEDRMAELDVADLRDLQVALGGQLADLTSAFERLEARVTALEERPTISVDSDDPGVAAISTEMDALRAQIAEMTDAAATELAEARAAAAAIEEDAAAAARNAAGRAALARVQSAMESGAPLGAALNDLEQATGSPAPAALDAVRDSVPTLAELQTGFPDVARAALATARREGVSGEETTGFGAFLRNQFDVRSTTPQEGDTADAILSRAEAAMRSGRLTDALAEISALPEVARAEMSGWLAEAEARADAVAAVDMLLTTLSDN